MDHCFTASMSHVPLSKVKTRLLHPSLYLAARRGVYEYEVHFDFLGWTLVHPETGAALIIRDDEAQRVVRHFHRQLSDDEARRRAAQEVIL